jgi:hypothetical protein
VGQDKLEGAMSRMTRLAVIAVLAGALSACASGPATSTAALVGQSGRIEVADSGFAVTLPDGWLAIGLTEADIDKLVGSGGNAATKAVGESLRRQAPALIAAGVKLWAFDTATASGSSLQMIVQAGSQSTAALRQLAQQFLDSGPGVAQGQLTEMTVSGLDGVRLDYGLERDAGAGTTLKANGTQVYASTKGKLYVLAITVVEGGRATAADEIVKSLEFLE